MEAGQGEEIEGKRINRKQKRTVSKMLLYPHFHKFNFIISFLLILSICVFVIGVLSISYAILYPLLFCINFHRKKKKKKKKERGGTRVEGEDKGQWECMSVYR